MRVSVVLDRRCFLMGAAGVAAVVTGAATGGGWRLTLVPSTDASVTRETASEEWAADHIFGTYPPYAHPIPYGRQVGVFHLPLEPGNFDPILMI